MPFANLICAFVRLSNQTVLATHWARMSETSLLIALPRLSKEFFSRPKGAEGENRACQRGFPLYIVREGQPARKCRVVWRSASGLGVEFGVKFI